MVFHAAHLAAQPNSSLKSTTHGGNSLQNTAVCKPFRVLDAVADGGDRCGGWGCDCWNTASLELVG